MLLRSRPNATLVLAILALTSSSMCTTIKLVYSTDRSKAVVLVLVLLFVALWFIYEAKELSAFRTFVRFALVWFCPFPLPFDVWEGLRLLIVALSGIFAYLFFEIKRSHKLQSK